MNNLQGRCEEPHCTQKSTSALVVSQSQPRLWIIWLFLGASFIILTASSRPDMYMWGSWVGPLPAHHSSLSEAAIRPMITLHPKDHVYRQSTTQDLDWHVTTGMRRPDGVLKRIYLINSMSRSACILLYKPWKKANLTHECGYLPILDLFPGPTIEARSGDTLIITVTNFLNGDSVSFHWHGLHVANAMDGATGTSQFPIAPGGRFVYNLTIPADQSGTFWYHSHTGVSRADGLYGGLVIHAPASRSTVRGLLPQSISDAHRYGYEKELLLLIGDWYHWPAKDVLAWYMTPANIGMDPVPDSLLINGGGYFNCSAATIARPVNCVEQPVNSSFLEMDFDVAYRIRVVNTGSLAGLSLVLDKEQLNLIQVDSIDVDPVQHHYSNSLGILYPGQRMDFILGPSHQLTKSSMTVQLDQEYFRFMNPSLNPNQTFPINFILPADPPIHPPEIRNKIDINTTPSASSVLQSLPLRPDQTFVVYTKIQKLSFNHNMPFGIFNKTTWRPQQDPLIPLIGLPRTKWDQNQFAITTGPEPVWIDIVVNNLDDGGHPFHMHGHSFYIMTVQKGAYGWGSYNPFEDAYPPGLELEPDSEPMERTEKVLPSASGHYPYNLSCVALRDTVYIPRRGYAVLRFRADNPGVWLFHCHMLWHFATGTAMLIDVQGDLEGEVAHDPSLLEGSRA
ncbi:multicopper oxidase-domain-containing protein [Penicillium sp. IBT 35674x]|nr:multicopper oxidase-domain-containing protein [Penicillium sp. IBT 35674x]